MYSVESLEDGMIHVLGVMEWDGVKFSSCYSEQCTILNLLFISGMFSFNNRGAVNHGYLQPQRAPQ